MKPKAVERGQWYRLTVRLTSAENATLERVSTQLGQSPNTLLRSVIMHLVPILGEVDAMIDPAQRASADEILEAMARVHEHRARYYRSLRERPIPQAPPPITRVIEGKAKRPPPEPGYQAALFSEAID